MILKKETPTHYNRERKRERKKSSSLNASEKNFEKSKLPFEEDVEGWKRARHISKETNFEQKGAFANNFMRPIVRKLIHHGRLSLNADEATST